MTDIFKTILLMSALGGGLTLILLLLKPITVKRFPARWQYCIWLAVTVSMLLPLWKFIPPQPMAQTKQSAAMSSTEAAQQEPPADTSSPQNAPIKIDAPPAEYREIRIAHGKSIPILDLAAGIWLAGTCLFLAAAGISYLRFLAKKRRHSIGLAPTEAFLDVKCELGIKRKIRLRLTHQDSPPMLVGVLFPVIYLPRNGLDPEAEKMIFRHELTHYRHGDLFFKWLTLFVSALHWFNPLVYLLSANVSQACELSCDMAVTSGMDDSEKMLYMQTILDIAEN